MEAFVDFINLLLQMPSHAFFWVLSLIFVAFIVHHFKIHEFVLDQFLYWLNFRPEDSEKIIERQNFARRVEFELTKRFDIISNFLSEQEKISRYIDLEVNISSQKKTKHLSSALSKPADQLILLRGEPGAGKSIALKHFALDLARKAKKSRNLRSLIPIYIDLKELNISRLENKDEIPSSVFRDLIFKSLNPIDDPSLKDYLDREFDKGLKNGSWLLIFDSFDEIPEILKSIQDDKAIQKYIKSLSLFLTAIYRSKAIIASRRFPGDQFNILQYSILPLDEKHRGALIRKSGLSPEIANRLIFDLKNYPILSESAKNPLFLSILCENISDEQQVSEAKLLDRYNDSVHAVFKHFIQNRLNRDEDRLLERFNLSTSSVHTACEIIAFTMTQKDIGLSPRQSVLMNYIKEKANYTSQQVEAYIQAISYTNIGFLSKLEDADPEFSFSHRKIQEYFASCWIINNQENPSHSTYSISETELLTDGRWREIIVTLLQTQEARAFNSILNTALCLIEKEFEFTKTDFSHEYEVKYVSSSLMDWFKPHNKSNNDEFIVIQLSESYLLLHILSFLQDGLGNRLDCIPPGLQQKIREILLFAYRQNSKKEKELAYEFSGLLTQDERIDIFLDGLSGVGNKLEESIRKNAPKLNQLPGKIEQIVITKIFDEVYSGKYYQEKFSLQAYLNKFSPTTPLINISSQIILLPKLDVFFTLLALVIYYGSSKLIENTRDWIHLEGFFFLSFVSAIYLWFAIRIKGLRENNSFNKIVRVISFIFRVIFVMYFNIGMIAGILVSDADQINNLSYLERFIMVIFYIILLYPLTISISVPYTYYFFIKKGELLHPLAWIIAPILTLYKEGEKRLDFEFLLKGFLKIRNKTISWLEISIKKLLIIIKNRNQVIALYKSNNKFRKHFNQDLLRAFFVACLSCYLLYLIYVLLIYIFSQINRGETTNVHVSSLSPVLNVSGFMVGLLFIYSFVGAIFSGHRKGKILKENHIPLDTWQLLKLIIDEKPANMVFPIWSYNEILTLFLTQKNGVSKTIENREMLKRLAGMIQLTQNLKAKYILFTLKPDRNKDYYNQWLDEFQSVNDKGIANFNSETLLLLLTWLYTTPRTKL